MCHQEVIKKQIIMKLYESFVLLIYMFERIYSIGCFDFLHHGHEKLLNSMDKMGKQLIIGIHDDNSLEQLKNLKSSEHQSLKIRMENLKRYADIIFVVPNTDPTFYLQNVISKNDNKENACFVRGDDMPNFPGRSFVEDKIELIFLPYTEGISSSIIRKEL